MKPPMKSLHKMVAMFVKECRASELPANKRRGQRNGNGRPLSAWMEAANNGRYESKITAILDGRVRSVGGPFNASVLRLADRISTRYQMTEAQYMLLVDYLFCRYRGRPPYMPYIPEHVLRSDKERWFPDHESLDFLREVRGKDPLPLRAIISPRMTDMVLLFILYKSVERSSALAR